MIAELLALVSLPWPVDGRLLTGDEPLPPVSSSPSSVPSPAKDAQLTTTVSVVVSPALISVVHESARSHPSGSTTMVTR